MSGPARTRRRAWATAVALLTAAALWLAVSRSEPPLTGRNFFGAWRTAPTLVAAALLWAAGGALLAALSRRALFAFLFGSLLAITTWAMLEAAVLFGVDYASLRQPPDPIGSEAAPHQDLRGTTYPDTAHAWNLPAQPIDFHFRTDRRGFRNDVDRADADVYLVGDSILVAGLLPFEQTVTALLENALGRPTINLALIGIGPQRELEILRGAGLPLRDRLVIQFVTEANDLGDSRRYRQQGTAARPSLASRSLTLQLVLWLQRRLQPVPYEAELQSGWIGNQRFLFFWVGDTVTGLEDEIAPALASFRAMHDHVRAAGGHHLLVLVPSKYRVLHELCRWPPQSVLRDPAANLSPLRHRLLAWGQAEAVPVLDLTAPFQAAARDGRVPYFADDTHPNAAGHTTMAEALLAWPPLRHWANLR
jgi:hypothetical protein